MEVWHIKKTGQGTGKGGGRELWRWLGWPVSVYVHQFVVATRLEMSGRSWPPCSFPTADLTR